MVKSRHAVCFGLGDEDDHLIINKDTGEINRIRDDGVNYYQDLLIIPPDHVDAFCQELDSFMGGAPKDDGGQGQENCSPALFGLQAQCST